MATGSSGSCYVLNDGCTTLLLEAGVEFGRVRKYPKYKTRHIAGYLITHEYGDYAECTKQFVNNGIISYMIAGTQRAMDFESHCLYAIKAKQELRIGTWSILPSGIEHDANEPVVFLLQSMLGYRVLYVTDTKYLEYKFNGITHMMLEINYIYGQIQESIKNDSMHSALANGIMGSHFSLEHAIGTLRANDLTRLEEIRLIHLSSQNSNAKYIRSGTQKVAGVPVYIGSL